jgi:hypothetical protein
MNVPSKRIVVALAYARNTRVFELLDDIAPGPALSTVLSPYPLVSLVALNIIQARNSHDSHSACGISSNKVATRKTIHIGGRDGWKVSGSNPSSRYSPGTTPGTISCGHPQKPSSALGDQCEDDHTTAGRGTPLSSQSCKALWPRASATS